MDGFPTYAARDHLAVEVGEALPLTVAQVMVLIPIMGMVPAMDPNLAKWKLRV